MVILEEFESVDRFFFRGFGKKIAKTLLVSPTDTATELMERSQAETVGRSYNDDGGIGDIDTDFNDGGGDQNVDFILLKLFDDGFFVLVFGLAVN